MTAFYIYDKKMTPAERREALIEALANFLTDDVNNNATLLTLGHREAVIWAQLYSAANVRPWATAEEAAEDIRRTFDQVEKRDQ